MIKIVLTNGMTHEFDENAEMLSAVLDWFKTANADGVVTLSAANGTWHLQKRHIAHIEVPNP